MEQEQSLVRKVACRVRAEHRAGVIEIGLNTCSVHWFEFLQCFDTVECVAKVFFQNDWMKAKREPDNPGLR